MHENVHVEVWGKIGP